MSPFGIALQKTYRRLARVDLALPEGLLIGLGYAATNLDSPLDFHQAQSAAERSGVAVFCTGRGAMCAADAQVTLV